jgi:outer membrane protein
MKNIALLFILSFGLFSCQQDKTAFVNNTEIMDGFEKLKQTEAELSLEEEALKAQLDSMVAESGYQDLVSEYQANKDKMSEPRAQELYSQIMQIQQQLGQQQQMRNQQFQQKSNTRMDSLVTIVKDFVKEYGKEKGYTFIYGANESGNILYGQEGLDITEEVTKALNDKYSVETTEESADGEVNELKEDNTPPETQD